MVRDVIPDGSMNPGYPRPPRDSRPVRRATGAQTEPLLVLGGTSILALSVSLTVTHRLAGIVDDEAGGG